MTTLIDDAAYLHWVYCARSARKCHEGRSETNGPQY